MPGAGTAALRVTRRASLSLGRIGSGAFSGSLSLLLTSVGSMHLPLHFIFGARALVTLLRFPRLPCTCLFFFFPFCQFQKKMICVKAVEIEFIYDECKLWPRIPEEAPGFRRALGCRATYKARCHWVGWTLTLAPALPGSSMFTAVLLFSDSKTALPAGL